MYIFPGCWNGTSMNTAILIFTHEQIYVCSFFFIYYGNTSLGAKILNVCYNAAAAKIHFV